MTDLTSGSGEGAPDALSMPFRGRNTGARSRFNASDTIADDV